MIIETIYTAESKKEQKTLRMMYINMQDSGMTVVFNDNLAPAPFLAELRVKESRRKRRSSQEVAEAALASGEAHL